MSDPQAALHRPDGVLESCKHALGYRGAAEPRRSPPFAPALRPRCRRDRVRPARPAARRRGPREAPGPPAARNASLELSLARPRPSSASPSCNSTFDGTPDGTTATTVRQFMDLVRIAFSCDLTRIVTILGPTVPYVPRAPGARGRDLPRLRGTESIEGRRRAARCTAPPPSRQSATSTSGTRGTSRICSSSSTRSPRAPARSSTTPSSSGSPSWRRAPTFYDALRRPRGRLQWVLLDYGRYVRYPRTFVHPPGQRAAHRPRPQPPPLPPPSMLSRRMGRTRHPLQARCERRTARSSHPMTKAS